MRILGIDPGPKFSAYALVDGDPKSKKNPEVRGFEKMMNMSLRAMLWDDFKTNPLDFVAVEEIVSYGMRVGKEVLDTCRWSGRFQEIAAHRVNETNVHLLSRYAVKMALCNTRKATDAIIRAAIIARYGGKEAAIGNKSAPGPLYSMHADEWQALAVALTLFDSKK